jgi:hypothetical protein
MLKNKHHSRGDLGDLRDIMIASSALSGQEKLLYATRNRSARTNERQKLA